VGGSRWNRGIRMRGEAARKLTITADRELMASPSPNQCFRLRKRRREAKSSSNVQLGSMLRMERREWKKDVGSPSERDGG